MSIGLGLILVVRQGLRLWMGKQLYVDMARFWTLVFGLIFAIGVATGIPMEFQFGTNWARYALRGRHLRQPAGDLKASALSSSSRDSWRCCSSAGTLVGLVEFRAYQNSDDIRILALIVDGILKPMVGLQAQEYRLRLNGRRA